MVIWSAKLMNLKSANEHTPILLTIESSLDVLMLNFNANLPIFMFGPQRFVISFILSGFIIFSTIRAVASLM